MQDSSPWCRLEVPSMGTFSLHESDGSDPDTATSCMNLRQISSHLCISASLCIKYGAVTPASGCVGKSRADNVHKVWSVGLDLPRKMWIF